MVDHGEEASEYILQRIRSSVRAILTEYLSICLKNHESMIDNRIISYPQEMDCYLLL